MAHISYIRANRLIELLKSPEIQKDMLVSILSTTKLGIGIDPLTPSLVLDMARERVMTSDAAKSSGSTNQLLPIDNNGVSVTEIGLKSEKSNFDTFIQTNGNWVEFLGDREGCRSQKHVLTKSLTKLETFRPGTLEKLTDRKSTSRRIVSRSRDQLFENSNLKHSNSHSEKLIDGWWVNTNNSAASTRRWLQTACECAGLEWDRDLKVGLA